MKYFFVILLSIVGFTNLYGQQKKMVATYHALRTSDPNDMANALKDSGLSLKQIKHVSTISKATITEGKLWIEDNKSAFRYVNSFLPEKYKQYDIPVDPSEWERMSIYIKDNSKKELFVVGKKLGRGKAVVDELAVHNDWQLLPKDSTINLLPCRLAVNKKYGYKAWYATKLPIAHGPEIFGGLPGLIVVLEIPEQERILVLQDVKEESFDEEIFVVGEVKKQLTYDEYKQLGY